MDSTDLILKKPPDFVDNDVLPAFTKESVFKAAAQGDKTQLDGLLEYLRNNEMHLTSTNFKDTNGKTALMKALMNLNDGKNDTIEVLLDIAEQTGDLKELINASYTDSTFKGQTALHIAIERRNFEYVKLLVEKGANVQAKANGTFFQRKPRQGFYFGELPLSLAACTNQPDIVKFLMENPHKRADVTDKDSQGNTVLHMLVVSGDNGEENTKILSEMYDQILVHHFKLEKKTEDLESIENYEGLTPLKLAAKLGKIGLFKHMLSREFMDEDTRPLSRKFTEWIYGPVHSSLYDMSSIDTTEDNSVLKIILFKSAKLNRPEMLQVEPLRSLLQYKWEKFASKLFLMHFLFYLLYLAIFTTVAVYRRDERLFTLENTGDYFLYAGEIISVIGAAWLFFKSITIFLMSPPSLKSLILDGIFEILFAEQGASLLIAVIFSIFGLMDYTEFFVTSLVLAWVNVLYYTRGSKMLGKYVVMMQRMILGDLTHFLCIYSVLLFGFSAAVVSLGKEPLTDDNQTTNGTLAPESSVDVETGYGALILKLPKMFMLTIGMGELEFIKEVKNEAVCYILVSSYIVLTYILMLNMLIALMGNTVETTSEQSEGIWNLQRAFTILDMERTIPKFLRKRLNSKALVKACFENSENEHRDFFRVNEKNWQKWRSDLRVKLREDPSHQFPQTDDECGSTTVRKRGLWNRNMILDRVRGRQNQHQQNEII